MFKKTKEPTDLDHALHRAHGQLKNHDADTKEYAQIVDQIVKLQTLQAAEKPKPISKDTWATVGANLAGILIIVAYEHSHVVTTKALGFVPKVK